MNLPNIFWPAERLMLEGMASLQELETWYNLDDIYDRCDGLDARSEIERLNQPKKDD